MTQEQIDQLQQEAAKIHERAREQGRVINSDERQRLAEISLLLAGGSDEEVQFLKKKRPERVAEAGASVPVDVLPADHVGDDLAR